VKIWPGLAPKEYSINTNVLLQVPRIGSYLSRRSSPKPRAAARWPGGSSCGHLRMVVWNEEREESRPVVLVAYGKSCLEYD